MKFFLVFLIFPILSESSDLRNLTHKIETEIGEFIEKSDAPSIRTYFSDDFSFKFCNGTVFSRENAVQELLTRKGALPKFEILDTQFLDMSSDHFYYVLREDFEAKSRILYTYNTVKIVGNQKGIIVGGKQQCNY
ncbi:unnamed protein product [Caenorhabditis angaria]|uniref:NTF2-like domain-containing protein n=1 Tax=Caenorhabditis angaria TaxID=860376 RepID=A0A9P1IF68_9PELO|nr:unnamed protein product [Caenorhabditis angaria]